MAKEEILNENRSLQEATKFLKVIIFLLFGFGPVMGNVILVLFGVLSKEFNATPNTILIAIPAFMFPFAFIQLFSGAISDIKGRFPVILFGLVIFGKDPVATDVVAARILGFNPYWISHLRFAKNNGIGRFNIREVGESISFNNVEFIPTLSYFTRRIGFFFNRHYFPKAARLFFYFSNLWGSRNKTLRQKANLVFREVKRRL